MTSLPYSTTPQIESDSAAIVRGITEKLSEQMGPLISQLVPPETFNRIAEAEIKKFMATTLPKMIQDEMDKLFRAELEKVLAGPDFFSKYAPEQMSLGDNYYGPGKQLAGAFVEQIIKENFTTLMTGFLTRVVGDTVMSMRNNMPRF